MNQRPPYPILCIHPLKNDGLQGYFPIGFWLLFRTKQWNFGRVFTVYLYFDPYLSCRIILKKPMGGPPDRWWPRWCRFNSFQFRARSVGNHFRYMKPSLAPQWEEKKNAPSLAKEGEKSDSHYVLPMHVCVCMRACMHLCYLCVYLSFYLSICASLLWCIPASPAKLKYSPDKRWWGAFDPSSKHHFSPGYVSFLGVMGKSEHFLDPSQKKTCNHTLLISTLPRIYQKIPKQNSAKMLIKCQSAAASTLNNHP